MTELEKTLFIRARILEGKTKEQAAQDCRKQVRLERLNGSTLIQQVARFTI